MRKILPETPLSPTAVLDTLQKMSADDIDWRRGRTPLYVFKTSGEVQQTARAAFNMYFDENALGARRAFASIQRMEADIVDIGLSLFNAPAEGAGFVTTGGTESIICAVKAARTASGEGKSERRRNLVVPETAHPAFRKAAELLCLEERRVPVAADYKADPAALADACDDDTIMIVASAPCFPYGVIDPIGEIGDFARSRGLWLHVDACVGGYLAPFARELGRDIPPFDFAVPGVISISADLHKYGYTPKPASTIFYRSADFAKLQRFDYPDCWPSGFYGTATIAGSRPGGAVAGAWATLHSLGHPGYLSATKELLDIVDGYIAGLKAIPGISIVGDPQLANIAFTHSDADMGRVATLLSERGWLSGMLSRPKALHLMMSFVHGIAREDYLRDVRECVAEVLRGSAAKSQEAIY